MPLKDRKESKKARTALVRLHEQHRRGAAAGGFETQGAGPGIQVHDPSADEHLEALRGVVKFPVRIKCATLSWNTLDQGISEATTASS